MEFLWKFCGVNIVESVSSFVNVKKVWKFCGTIIDLDEISNAIAIAHAN